MSLSNIKVNNSSIIGVDDEPITGSDNLVKSGGVYESSYRFNIFNKKEFLDCVKEFYVLDSNIDLSTIVCGRLHYGSSHSYALEFCSSTNFEQVVLELRGNLSSSVVKTANGSAYAIVDWNKVAYYCNGAQYINIYNLTVDNVKPKIEGFWPYVKAEIENQKLKSRISEWNMNISNSTIINECIKELYYDDKEVDLSQYTIFRFYYGSSSAYGAALFKQGYADVIIMYKYVRDVDLNSSFLQGITDNGHNWGIVLNWNKIQEVCGSALYKDFTNITLNPYIIQSPCYWPAIYSEIFTNKDSNYQHTIDVYSNQETPCQIANLIRSITDASADNRYNILVHSGTYEETDIVTKNYVDIIGESYEDTILVHDGDATYTSPADYSMGQEYSNVPVNTIPWKYKHLIFHMSNSIVKNITLKTVGGSCKYICHQDGGNSQFTAIFEHCNFVNGSGSNVLGVGAKAGQYMKYIDCQFVDNKNQDIERTHSFNLHNASKRSGSCGLRFENCSFIHTGWIHISDLGSNHTDYFEFINCVCNDGRTFIRFTKVQYDEDEPSYSIIVRVVGGNMGGIAPDGGRPNTRLSIQSRFINLIYSPNNIPFGTPLYNKLPAVNANNGYVFKLSDVDDVYNMKTISTYDVGFGLAEAGNYAYGDVLYINNGKFTKTPNGDIAGTVKQAIELSEDGYVMVQKTH